MKFLSVTAGLLMACASMFAHDVDGKWAGSLTTPAGDNPVAFTFKADGATLTGTTSGPDGAEVKIVDGKIDGNNLSFTVTFDFQGMPLMISYKGVMAGTEIKFTLDVFGMPLELSVKKST